MDETAKLNAMRHYWLGLLPENTCLYYETQWFDDDEDAELLTAVREDVIQDYLNGELSGVELTGFRDHLLGSLNFIEDVAIASAIYDTSATQKMALTESTPYQTMPLVFRLVHGFRDMFSNPFPAVAFGMLLVASLFVGVFFWRSEYSERAVIEIPQLSNSTTFPDTGIVGSETIPSDQPTQNRNTKRNASANASKTANPVTNRGSYITLVLGTTVRGNETLPEIKIPEKNNNLRLALSVPGLIKIYQGFSVRITAADSAKTVLQKPLGDLNGKRKGDAFFVTVPKGSIPPGDYRLVITGTLPGSVSENIYEQGFRILK